MGREGLGDFFRKPEDQTLALNNAKVAVLIEAARSQFECAINVSKPRQVLSRLQHKLELFKNIEFKNEVW